MADTQTGAHHEFQAEVNRILDIVVNSLYSKREVFLRELISNASDACDRLRYEAQLDDSLMAEDPDLAITVSLDEKASRITVTDNGIGMSRDELVANLGTIAGSGTAKFAQQLAEAEKEKSKKERSDISVIGQFGVGFYAVFMVAGSVTVTSRKAGSDEAWTWTSDGRTGFDVAEAPDDTPRGTAITLEVKKDSKEFVAKHRLESIIRTYSGHIGLPVWVSAGGESHQVNEAAALWTRPKSAISEDEYTEFYRHVAHGFDEPWLTLHNRAEGVVAYTNLLFIPTSAPFDLFDPRRQHGVKLYVRKVFITDECEGLIPPWLRFLRGIVDSEDLPLNVSREVLQNNPVVERISKAIVKRVLAELAKKAKKDAESYGAFWETFGAVLKEGVYEDHQRRDALMPLLRFRTTTRDGWVGLDDYVAAMKEGQDSIYLLTGERLETMRANPMLEAFRAKGVEVLLLDHPVDEFWTMSVDAYEDKTFVNVARGDINLAAIASDGAEATTDEKEETGDITPLVAMLKLALENKVTDVRESKRLTDSACCLVVDEGEMSMRLQKLLQSSGQDAMAGKRILEINPGHALIRSLVERTRSEGSSRQIEDMAHLLLDQALIQEGELPQDPARFAQRMSDTMARAVAA